SLLPRSQRWIFTHATVCPPRGRSCDRTGSVQDMSDIQCAARFLIVRHAESGADQGESASGPGLTERGIAQARALGEQLRGARIPDVFTSTMPRAQQTAEHKIG